jgi:hypothetical protein
MRCVIVFIQSSASDAQAQVQQLTQGMEELQALLKTASAGMFC